MPEQRTIRRGRRGELPAIPPDLPRVVRMISVVAAPRPGIPLGLYTHSAPGVRGRSVPPRLPAFASLERLGEQQRAPTRVVTVCVLRCLFTIFPGLNTHIRR